MGRNYSKKKKKKVMIGILEYVVFICRLLVLASFVPILSSSALRMTGSVTPPGGWRSM